MKSHTWRIWFPRKTRNVGLVISLAVVLAAAGAKADTGRYAVLIGIDDYSASRMSSPSNAETPASRRPLPSLRGAVNDVVAMSEMLVSLYRFDRRHIIMLTNQEATREAIFRAIERGLIEPVRKGDVVLFYYAGHGSKVPNAASDEPDKMDETIVPADSRFGAHDIRDKELRQRFNRVLDRGAHLTVVLDTCYSGSGARDSLLLARRTRGVAPAERHVTEHLPVGPKPEDRGALIVSASQDDGTAAELTASDGQGHGAFSWAWFGALRDADSGEPVMDTFLRARARLQLTNPRQEPVLAGNEEARLAPFLGERADRRNGRTVVAVERLKADGTIVLQGGWANGIAVGSRLDVKGQRLEVVSVQGINKCRARFIAKPSAIVKPGALAEVVEWTAPPGALMRLWTPATPTSHLALIGAAERISQQAAQRNLHWIDDPADDPPAYILRPHQRLWDLVSNAGVLGTSAKPETLLEKIPRGQSLYMQLPVTDGLVAVLKEAAGVEFASQPESADYVLAGRYVSGRLEYAWIRAGGAKGDNKSSSLPVRADWKPASATAAIRESMLRLRRIYAWMTLLSPPGMRPPYTLLIRNARSNAVVTDGILTGGERYGVLLHPRPGVVRPANPRYVYVFSIDSYGKSVLVYPVNTGSVENRVSIPRADTPMGPADLFRAVEPYGIDTYFLLTSEEALPNPSIFNFDGVKTLEVRGKTPLERLLMQTNDPARGMRLIPTAPEWSIERIAVESTPAALR